jgi:fumarate reductase (CoM/CoB) subunit B
MGKATVFVRRFDPSSNRRPHFEKHEVPYQKGMRVLDILEHINNVEGRGLAYRWFCGVKRCGLCALNVNGKPALACWEEAQEEMVIEPLSNFEVIRDLVIDRKEVDKALVEEGNVLEREGPYTGFPEYLPHKEMGGAYPLMNCIDCLVCVGACPVMKPGASEKFQGPYSVVQMAKLALDPRDKGDRGRKLINLGLEECDECGECTKACPNSIDILEDAIKPSRRKYGIRKKVYAEDACRQKTDEEKRVESFMRAVEDER